MDTSLFSSGERASVFGSPPGEDTVVVERRLSTNSEDRAAGRRARGKRRNKPTLNCLECVERKSKCDRGRPSCFICIRRQTDCHYTPLADVLVANAPSDSRKRRKTNQASDHSRRLEADCVAAETPPLTGPPPLPPPPPPPPPAAATGPATWSNPAASDQFDDLAVQRDFGVGTPQTSDLDRIFQFTPFFTNAIEPLAPLVIPSPTSSRPRERHAILNPFGAASTEHPFRTRTRYTATTFHHAYISLLTLTSENYWTDLGGLAEVVASLPSKNDATVLIERFYETVDPIYPIVPRDAFVADVEHFWSLSDQAKHRHDPAQIALQFAVYANAAYETSLQEGSELQSSTSTFYLSCCHQSLCISSYLNRCSLLTIQTVILMCHFMVACNRIADAWSISGIVQRHIYALKLNRRAEDLGLDIDPGTLQIRLRLWQAAMMQDALLSLSLKKPPSTTHFDVSYHDLRTFPSAPTCHDSSDVAYVRTMWRCSALIQETICNPRSTQQPLAVDAAHRSRIIARFRGLYAQLEQPFCQTAPSRFDNLPPRLLYQMATVASHYFYALMLLFIDKNEQAGVRSDPFGAIRAAHEGMTAFFALTRLYPSHTRVWAPTHNRTYAMAAVIGTMLTLQKNDSNNNTAAATHTSRRAIADDPQLMLGKSDFDRYINMLGRTQGSAEFRVLQRERLANLKALQEALQDV